MNNDQQQSPMPDLHGCISVLFSNIENNPNATAVAVPLAMFTTSDGKKFQLQIGAIEDKSLWIEQGKAEVTENVEKKKPLIIHPAV